MVIKRRQVVYDKLQSEYVNFLSWVAGKGRALVFNPRCGEKYETTIRLLTRTEIGNYGSVNWGR